jgi:hypothetical protein
MRQFVQALQETKKNGNVRQRLRGKYCHEAGVAGEVLSLDSYKAEVMGGDEEEDIQMLAPNNVKTQGTM